MGFRSTACVVLALIAGVLGGCSDSETVDSAKSAARFVEDTAGGGTKIKWTLGANPSAAAMRAWENRERIKRLAEKIQELGEEAAEKAGEQAPDWGCETLDALRDDAPEPGADAENQGVSPEAINTFLAEARLLSGSEQGEVAAAACKVYASR
jgi:hypothetical protein